ncbi:MAG: hypothetical protein CL840_12935 [Crocinitomicaceae bacterium]|nr:hypothetical protein [Crocinitomicaceae bacterium]|tara:strand:+ start:206 stop:826 length:621 start_codon:yes stop_codon:yes gene_type:complete
MKTGISLLLTIASFISIAQTRIGTIGAFQVVDKEIQVGDLVLYYPVEPVRVEGALWLTLELGNQPLATFIELTKENRMKLISILESYNKLKNVIETPEKLPNSQNLGQITVRAAFGKQGAYNLDPAQNVLFYVKFDKNGKKTLAMAVGKLESKNNAGTTHGVPLLWFDDKMVNDFLSEVSEENIAAFLRNKGKTISPDALKLMHEN